MSRVPTAQQISEGLACWCVNTYSPGDQEKIFCVKAPRARQACCSFCEIKWGENLIWAHTWDSSQCTERGRAGIFSFMFIVPVKPHFSFGLLCINREHPGAGVQHNSITAWPDAQLCSCALLLCHPYHLAAGGVAKVRERNAAASKWLGKNRKRPMTDSNHFSEITVLVFGAGT